jgi:hypothetical protein
MKNKFKLLWHKLKKSMFGEESDLDLNQILNPPSWRERQVQNQLIDKEYEQALQAKDPHWSDRYDKDFKNVKKEVVRVRES